MSSPSAEYLSEESEEGTQQTVVIPAMTPPTAQQLTLEDLLLMQQMGLTLPDSDSDSPQGIQIPVEPGQLLMGNGPLPIQDEGEDGYIVNHVEDEEEEGEQDEEEVEAEGEEEEEEE